MIRITSKLHGVEVAGMRHPAKTVHYTDDQITDEQLAEMAVSEYLTVELDGDSVGRSDTLTGRELTQTTVNAENVNAAPDHEFGAVEQIFSPDYANEADEVNTMTDVADAVTEDTAAMDSEKTADDVNPVDVVTEQAEAELVANVQSKPEQPTKPIKSAKTKK